MSFVTVALENKTTGARIEGEYIADTGPTWMVKPAGKPVQVLNKSEWDPALPSRRSNFDDIFSMFGGGVR